jgi:uncharacterized protein (DUF2062 family)
VRSLRNRHNARLVKHKKTSMRRWLKRITPDRQTLEAHWFLRHFAALFLDRACWAFHRHSVTRAFAVGLFIAFIPPTPLLPVHLVTCALLGVYFRLNLPVLFTTVFVSNPFTWLPQIAASLWVGAKLMGLDFMPFMREIRHQTFWTNVSELWPPLLLGALVLGSIAGLIGYLLAQCVWRARVAHHLRRRRARSSTPAPLN